MQERERKSAERSAVAGDRDRALYQVCDLAVVPVHLDERIRVPEECHGVVCELKVRLDERPGAREQVDAFTVHACLD